MVYASLTLTTIVIQKAFFAFTSGAGCRHMANAQEKFKFSLINEFSLAVLICD